MSFKPNPRQTLFLWNLLGHDGQYFMKDLACRLPVAERAELVRENFLEEIKQPSPQTKRPAFYNIVTDKGWAWSAEHLDATLPKNSTKAALILQLWLTKLSQFMEHQQLSLADFLTTPTQEVSPENGISPDSIAERIRAACIQLGEGKTNIKVRLANLRQTLSDVPPQALNSELFRLEKEGTLALFALENPEELTEADKDAAIHIGNIGVRHILYYLKG